MDPKKLKKPGEAFSLADIDVPQGKFREQVDVVADELRQLAGNPEFKVDPLSAPYVLFVNGYTGVDTFVGGLYQNTEDDIERRISNQKLECGYSEARPFKTINRAAIEAAIITSRSFFTEEAQKARALVSIVVAPGEYTAFNGRGASPIEGNFPPRADGFVPTNDELTSFNDQVTGGIILPRGCSLVSLDLRKTIIRPAFVPEPEVEFADYSNRRSIFKVTGTGYYYGFTFKDAVDFEKSHHLLTCFEFTPKQELEEFYSKILLSFASAGINAANTVPKEGESQIVAPKPPEPEFDTDGVTSASPYIYNTSIRSIYGLCGVFANGAVSTGFRSMVIAQFTGVSLNKDLSVWQAYTGGRWVNNLNDYVEDYIKGDPNDIRMDPFQRSFHIRAVNDSIIQEVSVFAIGQGVHHWTETGGELTITNSNSNFGGCSGLSEGFKATAAPQDGPYSFEKIKRAIDPFSKSSNIKRITLGNLVSTQDDDSLRLELVNPLDESRTVDNQPDLLARDNYSLKEDDYVWVENPNGADYRARLAANPYRANEPNIIRIKDQLATDANNSNGVETQPGKQVDLENTSNEFPPIAGLTVYVRRFRDVRSVAERRYAVVLDFGSGNRIPPKDYALLQTGLGEGSNQIGSGDRVVSISSNEIFDNDPGAALIELRASKRREQDTEYDEDFYYRPGDVVRRANKHFIARRITFGPFNPDDWDENYVHMEEGYAPGGFFKSKQPILIFDKDTDNLENSRTLGNTLDDVNNQLRSATDYIGVQELLRSLNVGAGETNSLLRPVASVDDEFLDVRSEAFNEDLECRRPSVVRMFGQAYEWTGFLNYTKGLPNYQQVLSPSNKFSYYFTSSEGGIVYANGFNEEGLAVSPRGLEDVNTGQFLSLEDVGNPDRSIDLPTDFENVTISGKLELLGEAEFIGPEAQPNINPDVKDNKVFGIVSLASTATIQDPLKNSMAANTDDDITAKDVMTLMSTNLWARQQGFVTARSGVQKVYVDPVNGRDIRGQAVFDNPPTMPTMAVKSIKAAADFINSTYSPAETVQLLLGPGVYSKDKGSIVFNPIMEVKSFNIKDDTDLCDDKDSYPGNNKIASVEPGETTPQPKPGQTPFMGQMPVNDPGSVDNRRRGKLWDQRRAYLEDPENHPILLTSVSYRDTGADSFKLNIEPTQLRFTTRGSVQGLVWFGIATSLDAVGDDPDNFFDSLDAGQLIQLQGTDREDRLTQYIVLTKPGTRKFAFLETRSCIYSFSELEVVNCAFEAIGPAVRFSGNRNERAVIGCSTETVKLRGLWFIGQTKIEKTGPGDGMPTLANIATGTGDQYKFTGHHNAMVSSELVDFEENGASLLVSFGGSALPDLPGQRDYNLTWNNFHFVDDDLNYVGRAPNTFVSPTDVRPIVNEVNLNTQAPAFKGIISQVIGLGQFGVIWNLNGVEGDEEIQGIGGYLGRYTDEDPNLLIFTKGIASVPNGAVYNRVNKDYYFQVAGLTFSDRRPDPIGRPRFPTGFGDFEQEPGAPGRPDTGIVIECVGANDTAYFPEANINCTAIAQGVNPITAVTCSQDLII